MGPRVDIIGLGVIGLPIAERVAAAGSLWRYTTYAPNLLPRSSRRGAQSCCCAAEVAASSDIVIRLVLDEKQTEAVLCGPDGAAPMLGSGTGLADRGRWHCNRTRRSQCLSRAAR